jgi:8-oxo-dGTP pyrophosphatase MutT (NUDIX family)
MQCESRNIEEVLNENRTYYFCADCNKLYDRAFDTRFGRDIVSHTPKHRSVGAFIQRGDKFLVLKRKSFPFGYDLPAGHIEFREKPLDALKREVFEETGLKVKKTDLLYEGDIEGDKCRYGADIHYWYFYACEYEGATPVANAESSSIVWVTAGEAEQLPLSHAARFFLPQLVPQLSPPV